MVVSSTQAYSDESVIYSVISSHENIFKTNY